MNRGRPVEVSDQLARGNSTAGFELARMARLTDNPVMQALSALAKEHGLATQVRVVPRAELDAMVAQQGRSVDGRTGLTNGMYRSDDVIFVADDLVGTQHGDKVIAHEAAHALTADAIHQVQRADAEGTGRNISGRTRGYVRRLETLFEEAKAALPDNGQYWRTNLDEFVAEAWSNEAFQRQLANTPSARPTRSIWDQLVQAVRRYFKTPEGQRSLLEEVLEATPGVIEDSRRLAAQSGGLRGRVLRSADESSAQRVWRQIRERQRNVDIPRAADDPVNQADVQLAQDLADNSARDAYYGEQIVGGRMTKRGAALPMSDGTYRVTTTDGFDGVANTADEARRMLQDNGIRARKSSDVNPSVEGQAFVDQYAKASPIIRGIAQTVRNVVARVNPDAAELAGTRTLDMLGKFMTDYGSQWYFLDKMDNAAEALSGVNPQLSLRVRNTMRELGAVGRFDTLGDLGRKIATTINRSGVTDMAEASQYLVARHVVERNARLRGKPIPGGAGNYGDDVTGFTFDGKSGDAAATAFIESLTPAKRTVLDAVADSYDQAKQYTLAYQLQSGMISESQYRSLGGRIGNQPEVEGAWTKYIPLKDWRSDLVGKPGGRMGSGQGGRSVDYSKQLMVAFTDLEQQVKAAHRNSAYAEIARTARAYPQLMDARVEAKQASPARSGRAGDDVTWREEDFHGKDSLVFFENGQRKTITFSDPHVQQFLEARRATPGLAVRSMGAVTRLMAASRTTLSPAFWLQSVGWDTTMALLGMEAAARGTLTSREALRVSQRTLALMPGNLSKLAGRATTNATDDPFLKLYGLHGGGVAPGSRSGLEDVTAHLEQSVNPLTSDISNPWSRTKATASRFMNILHSTEDMTRFSAFQAYIEFKAGKKFESYDSLTNYVTQNPSVLDQALDVSRRITGDFSDRGAAAWPRAAFMFFNPAVAGARQLTSIAQTRTGGLGLAAMFALGASLAAGYLGDEEDIDEDGGSRYLRRQNRGRAFPLSDSLAFPLAPEVRAPYTAGESLVAASKGKMSWGQAIARTAGSIVDTFAPLNIPDADAPIESYAYGLAPAILQPLIVAAFGVDSWGNDTEIDANLARGPTGERIPFASNAERGRSRDPQFIKDAAVWAQDTLGIDMFPGRLWELARVAGGSSLAFLQRSATEGPGSAITRSYQNRYDEYAIRDDYTQQAAEYEQALRAAQRTGNALRVDPGTARNLSVMRSAENMIDQVRVNGYSLPQLYRARDYYRAAGSDEGVLAVEQLISNAQQVQNKIRASALQAVRTNQP